MKRIVFVIVLVLCSVGAVGAQHVVPNNDKILAATMNSESPFYYPSLKLRYDAGDTTLMLADYHYLYYGYAFQDEYKPLEPLRGATELILAMEQSPNPTREDAQKILDYAKVVFEQDPFSPRNINFMTYAYGMLGDTINERVCADRLNKIIATIEGSGTGLKEDSPMHVLWFSHVNDYLAMRQIDIVKRRVVSRTVEYVQFVKREGKAKGYYFDFGRMYWKKPENADGRPDGIMLKQSFKKR